MRQFVFFGLRSLIVKVHDLNAILCVNYEDMLMELMAMGSKLRVFGYDFEIRLNGLSGSISD